MGSRLRNRPTNIVAAAMLAALFSGPAAHAAVFNPHRIMGDEELRSAESMSYEDIRVFLANKGALSQTVDVDPIDGLLKNAAQLIDDAAKRYRVNPKYILVLIQKESSAVESDGLTQRQLDWATGYALCDGCSRAAPLAQKYKGFARQVDAGAGYIDWYFKNAASNGVPRKPGETIVISSTKVTPANVATAALYTYTPHLHGNRLLWSIWNRWFGDGTSSLRFPDGTLVRNERTGAVAVIQSGRFRAIMNPSVLASRFNASSIVDLNEYEFAGLSESIPGRPMRFSDLSLVRTETGATYLLVGSNKRRIVSDLVFAKIGFNPEEVEDIKAEDVEDYADGEPITLDAPSPLGELLQNTKTGGVYYVEAGVKRPLLDRAALAANFRGRPIMPTSPAELDKLVTGEPVRFNDGALVKSPNDATVFVISGGKKRQIPSEEVFLMFGYRWTNVLTTSLKTLSLHETGDPLAIEAMPTDEISAATPLP